MGYQCGFFCLLALLWILTATQLACRHTTKATRFPAPPPITSAPREPVDHWDDDGDPRKSLNHSREPVDDPWDESDPRRPVNYAARQASLSHAYSKARRKQQVRDNMLSALRMNGSDVARANDAVRRRVSRDHSNDSIEFMSTLIHNFAQKGRNRTVEPKSERNAEFRRFFESSFQPRQMIIFPAPFPTSLEFPSRQHNIVYFDVSRLSRISSPKIESSSLYVFVVAASEDEASAPLTLAVYDQTFNTTVPPPRTFYHHPDTGCQYCIIKTTWTLEQNLITMVKGINITENGQWIQIPLGRFPQRWVDHPLENRGLAVYNGTYPQYSWVQAGEHVVIPGLHKEPYLHLKLTVPARDDRPCRH